MIMELDSKQIDPESLNLDTSNPIQQIVKLDLAFVRLNLNAESPITIRRSGWQSSD
jgi:hypothetical protein